MTIQHINLTDLTPAALNVRKHGAKDVTDLIHSIRAIGLLQPLVVRPNAEEDGYDVIAGQRRYHALVALSEEQEQEPIPCVVLQAGDDAAAIEASLAENIARLPMDEVDQYKAFAKLIKEGRTVEDIALSFGLTDRAVEQRLALGKLHGPILTAYRKGDLDVTTIRHLTLATAKQQKDWWALVKDEDAYAPRGRALKDWLFGGTHIPTCNALFDVETSGLAVVSDLFGEEAYFADSLAFWAKQNEAIAEMMATYTDKGWSEVIVMDIGAYFSTWDHRKTSKKDGGKVYITCSAQGEVTTHEGYISSTEAKQRDKAESGEEAKPARPELTKAMQNYLALHRHAAVRSDLLGQPQTALRLIAAHMIAGSSLWQVHGDPLTTSKETIAESLQNNAGHIAIEAERAEINKLLGFDADTSVLERKGQWEPRPDIMIVYATLSDMDDATVQRILTFLMAESLAAGSNVVETLAATFDTDMSASWAIDDTFFDLIRDKDAINSMVAEIAGENVAAQHVTSTAKAQKAVIKACLNGDRIAKTTDWTPRYMQVPMQGYTDRSGFAEVAVDAAQPEAIAAE